MLVWVSAGCWTLFQSPQLKTAASDWCLIVVMFSRYGYCLFAVNKNIHVYPFIPSYVPSTWSHSLRFQLVTTLGACSPGRVWEGWQLKQRKSITKLKHWPCQSWPKLYSRGEFKSSCMLGFDLILLSVRSKLIKTASLMRNVAFIESREFHDV